MRFQIETFGQVWIVACFLIRSLRTYLPSLGRLGEFRYIVEIQLMHNVLAVGLNGFYTYFERSGDLLCCFTFRQKLEHFTFPGSKDRGSRELGFRE